MEFRRPDFGQPKEEPDVRGLVSSITGNEVMILKMERPEFDREQAEDDVAEEDNEGGEGEQTRTFGVGGGMSGMGGGPGRGMGRSDEGGEMDKEASAQMLERMKEMSSGEETVLIPVGIQMLKPDTSADGKQPAMIEATLEDITANKMIQVWLDDSVTDRQVAEFVLILR